MSYYTAVVSGEVGAVGVQSAGVVQDTLVHPVVGGTQTLCSKCASVIT